MRKNSLRSQSPTLTPEELAKTQVLNLSDVEKVANYEKATSKKPAMLLAIIGVMFVSIGLLYPSVRTMMSSDSVEKKTTEEKINKNDSVLTDESTSQARVEEEVIPTKVTCKISNPGNPDGTDTSLVVNLNFENNKLKSFSKHYAASATVGNPTGTTTIQNLINGYRYFETVPIEGYQISTIPTETGNGFFVNINVDLKTFNPQTLPTTHLYNDLTNVTYLVDTDQTTLVTQMTTNGYICQ